MQILFIFLAVILFGLMISILLIKGIGVIERLGLSYILGLGIYTFVVFVTQAVFNTKFTKRNFEVTLFLLLVLVLIVNIRNIKKFVKSANFKLLIKLKKFTFFEKLILMGIVSLFLYSFINSLYWPVSDWDALALYDFRAKVFVYEGSLKDALKNWNYFLGYPLLTSLSHVAVYFFGGNNPRFIYSLFYLSFLLMFYGSLARRISRKNSLLFTLLLASVPEVFGLSMVAYTNLPYTVYVVMSAIYLYDWLVDNKAEYLYVSALLLGLSTWTRSSEPFWIAPLLLIIVFSLTRKKLFSMFLSLLIFFSIRQPWKIYEGNFLEPGYLSTGKLILYGFKVIFSNFSLERFTIVLNYLNKSVFSTWGLIGLVFIFCALWGIFGSIKKKIDPFLLLIFLFLSILVAGTFVFSTYFESWERIGDSARRMSVFFLPLFIFYIGLFIGRQD